MTPLPRESNRLPRATCPECQRDVALRNGGQLREHRDESGDICPASGLTTSQAEQEIERSLERISEALAQATRRAGP